MIRERAPAKVNLLLHVGPRRGDGLHELCSIFAAVELADRLAIEESPEPEDLVLCTGVEGPNLAEAAIVAFRLAAREVLPPLRVTIEKRIPVAAGLGGGSADAAAVLRGANELLGRPCDVADLRRIAMTLGADVPSQVEPGHALVTGAGEEVEPLALPDMALVLARSPNGLGAADVYTEADRLAVTRPRLDPDRVRQVVDAPLAELAAVLESDLEAAVLSLRPELREPIDELRARGALASLVTGSGPTVFGVFPERSAAEHAASLTSGSLVTMVGAPRGGMA